MAVVVLLVPWVRVGTRYCKDLCPAAGAAAAVKQAAGLKGPASFHCAARTLDQGTI